MEINQYNFNSYNDYTADNISSALQKHIPLNKTPLAVCIGSDLVLGDSLGPLVGTLLKKKSANLYVYGTLNQPITAKDVCVARNELKQLHPNTFSIAIDASIGEADDVGLIKVINKGLKPGLGVNKKLGVIGDVSIIGVVAGKSLQNYNLYNLTRLNLVYKMAETIADGIIKFLTSRETTLKNA
ncbi:MAG: spore protease YyaC [Clostridia bacterium]|nr:spore protease YyaC [Clostridia bacterium]